MTLDPLPEWMAHRRLRDSMQEWDRKWEDFDPDAGSPEAEEIMLAEGAAWRREHEPWRNAPTDPYVDTRTYPSAGTEDAECWRTTDIPWDAA